MLETTFSLPLKVSSHSLVSCRVTFCQWANARDLPYGLSHKPFPVPVAVETVSKVTYPVRAILAVPLRYSRPAFAVSAQSAARSGLTGDYI